ncbi:MAG: hypothetical protein ABIK83_00935 [Candidatus Zixiibacteriota bacterium]
MNIEAYSETELQRWSALRAMEWGRFPLFVTQPIAPVLLLIAPWWLVVITIVALNLLWGLVRYKFVSTHLANFGCVFVRLKWISCPGMAILFYLKYDDVFLTLLSSLWPFVTLVLMLVQFGPVNLGKLQRMFMKELGLLPEWMSD